MKPRILDLFCGAGGCSVGYARAGFEVVGVDIAPQPNYPFEFWQRDAIMFVKAMQDGFESLRLSSFDAIHASPPCQDYSLAMRHLAKPKPRLIAPIRELLEATGLPWVIENVPGAPIPTQSTLEGRHGTVVCGASLGMRISRHRLFEANFPLHAPACHCRQVSVLNPHRAESRERIYAEFGRRDPEILWRDEMGVSWMGRYEAREAIPPAYTELIGGQLLNYLREIGAAA